MLTVAGVPDLARDRLDLLVGEDLGGADGERAQIELADPLQLLGQDVGGGQVRAGHHGSVVAHEGRGASLEGLGDIGGQLGGAVDGVVGHPHVAAAEHADVVVHGRERAHALEAGHGSGRIGVGVHDRHLSGRPQRGQVQVQLAGGLERPLDLLAGGVLDHGDQIGAHLLVGQPRGSDGDQVPLPDGQVAGGADDQAVVGQVPRP